MGFGRGRQSRARPSALLRSLRALSVYFCGPAVIFTVFGFTDSDFGKTSSRTPLVNVAVTAFASICIGRVDVRWNFTVRRSWRSQPSLATFVAGLGSPANG